MTAHSLKFNRRTFLAGLAATTAIGAVGLPDGAFAQVAKKGGTLNTPVWPAATYLNSAISTAGTEAFLSPKFFDGLLGYDFGLKPRAALATEWQASEDGKTITFKLRPDVKWHDGQPFTSKDVAFTFMNVLKVLHGRGKTTFAGLTEVQTPDDLTAVFVLARPTPAIMRALDSRESPILPAHIYEGTDIMTNPANTAPIGTGAFKLESYERGASVVMVRNPDYWDTGYPLLDKIVVQFIPDAATRASMLESGQADAVFLNLIPAQDILRIGKMDGFEIEMKGFETSPSSQQMDFNLDNPILADIDVRRAIAHAIDLKWITDNVWYGLGKPGKTPLHHDQAEYFTTEGVPSYEYDLAKANAMLDKKYPKKDDGMRFKLTLDPSPWGTESITAATYIKEQMRQIGIDLTVRTQDFAVFVKTVYTDRKHDLALYTAYMGTDPTIGVQRFYWSKSFKPGVGFANGAHYSNPEVDAVLEAAQIETDAAKRKEQYKKFQQLAMTDLPVLVVTTISMATVAKKTVRDHAIDAVGSLGNLAHTWIDA